VYSFKQIFPSLCSSLRLLVACVFPFCDEGVWPWLIIVAGLSDLVDGWLARRWQVVSWYGGLIDAISDKCFVLTVLIIFMVNGMFSPLWVPFIIARDIVVLITALYIVRLRFWDAFQRMPHRITGKIATGGQFVLFFLVALFPSSTLPALLFASLCSIISAADYARLFYLALQDYSPELNNEEPKNPG